MKLGSCWRLEGEAQVRTHSWRCSGTHQRPLQGPDYRPGLGVHQVLAPPHPGHVGAFRFPAQSGEGSEVLALGHLTQAGPYRGDGVGEDWRLGKDMGTTLCSVPPLEGHSPDLGLAQPRHRYLAGFS
jgi:hypothetical protein